MSTDGKARGTARGIGRRDRRSRPSATATACVTAATTSSSSPRNRRSRRSHGSCCAARCRRRASSTGFATACGRARASRPRSATCSSESRRPHTRWTCCARAARCSARSSPSSDFSRQLDVAERLIAAFPGMLLYWHHFARTGKRIATATDAQSTAGHFLQLLHGVPPSALHERAMDASLILYAEHEFNASTFTARVCAATLSDIYSAVTGAIGSLRGPLHGGANEAAMELIERFDSPRAATAGVKRCSRARSRSWASDTPSIARPTRAMP